MSSGEEAALISICVVLGVVTLAFAAWVAYVNKRVHREWDTYAMNESNRAATSRRACQALSSLRRKYKCGEYQQFHARQRVWSESTMCSDNDSSKTGFAPKDIVDLEAGVGGSDKCFDDTACPICLNNYNPTDIVCELKCRHMFHEKCLVSWFLTSNVSSCPMCRSNAVVHLPPPPVVKRPEWDCPDWNVPGVSV